VDSVDSLYVADTDNQTIRWGAPALPALTSATTASITVGVSFTYTATFSRVLAGPFTVNGLSSGLSFNTSTGAINGIPNAAGTFVVTLGATNGAGTGTGILTLSTGSAPAAPTISVQPASQVVAVGGNVTFSVTASGTPAPAYQWRKDGAAISGATNSSLTLSAVSASNAGSYTVIITNSAGSVTSSVAALNIAAASALSNLSVRTTMAAGQVLPVGAVVSGGAKTILVRAAGPALNPFGLTGMVDPRLELYTTGSLPAAVNDDWPASLAPTFASLAAFPFTNGSRDSALSQSLNGSFTVQADLDRGHGRVDAGRVANAGVPHPLRRLLRRSRRRPRRGARDRRAQTGERASQAEQASALPGRALSNRRRAASLQSMTMREEYDFSQAERGPMVPVPKGKTRITIALDEDVVEWFKRQVHAAGGGNYQTLINKALREYIEGLAERGDRAREGLQRQDEQA
jgi:uncharacterized protein (DUF4415 family)